MIGEKTRKLVYAALFAALTCVMTMIVKIPVPATGGYVNLGDCVVLLAGWVLGPMYGGAAAGLGSMLADLVSGYPLYAPGTFVIKACMAVCAWAVFRAAAGEKRGLAARIGADVPFFLYNVPCRASGIGERLVPCPEWLDAAGVAGAGLVLLCPRERVSTPWAYAAWDEWNRPLTEARNGAINRASQKPLDGASSIHWLENSFEPPVFEAFPRLRRLREQLLRQGAFAAVMSGSGSSLFGLFRDAGTAFRVAEGFREKDVAAYSHAL